MLAAALLFTLVLTLLLALANAQLRSFVMAKTGGV